MDLAAHLRIQAHANRLANLRLHGAMAALDDAAFHAPRTGFFPSLAATLNHILVVDRYYIGALHGDAGLVDAYRVFVPAATLPELRARQAESDERLIASAAASTPPAATRPARWTAATTCSTTASATCSRTSSCTRRTTAARRTRCCRAPRSRRRSSTSS